MVWQMEVMEAAIYWQKVMDEALIGLVGLENKKKSNFACCFLACLGLTNKFKESCCQGLAILESIMGAILALSTFFQRMSYLCE